VAQIVLEQRVAEPLVRTVVVGSGRRRVELDGGGA
jgi:hypothetical protein